MNASGALLKALKDLDSSKEVMASVHSTPLRNLTSAVLHEVRERFVRHTDRSPAVQRCLKEYAKLLARRLYVGRLVKAGNPTEYRSYMTWLGPQAEPTDAEIAKARCKLGAVILKGRQPEWASLIDDFVKANPQRETLQGEFYKLVEAAAYTEIQNRAECEALKTVITTTVAMVMKTPPAQQSRQNKSKAKKKKKKKKKDRTSKKAASQSEDSEIASPPPHSAPAAFRACSFCGNEGYSEDSAGGGDSVAPRDAGISDPVTERAQVGSMSTLLTVQPTMAPSSTLHGHSPPCSLRFSPPETVVVPSQDTRG